MGMAKAMTGMYVISATLVLIFLLSACTTNRPDEDSEPTSSGPTVYGQLGVSVDWVNVER
jgi:hypothetical protein